MIRASMETSDPKYKKMWGLQTYVLGVYCSKDKYACVVMLFRRLMWTTISMILISNNSVHLFAEMCECPAVYCAEHSTLVDSETFSKCRIEPKRHCDIINDEKFSLVSLMSKPKTVGYLLEYRQQPSLSRSRYMHWRHTRNTLTVRSSVSVHNDIPWILWMIMMNDLFAFLAKHSDPWGHDVVSGILGSRHLHW